MSGYIYWSAVCAFVALASHLLTKYMEMRNLAKLQWRMNRLTDEYISVDSVRRSGSERLRRAVALLRDDAHRSRTLKDGSSRYEAWKAERDALIREVEG